MLLVYGLLVCGRYVGEERILALRQAVRRRLRRAPRRLPRPAPARPLASLRHRRPRFERGPPLGYLAVSSPLSTVLPDGVGGCPSSWRVTENRG